MQDKVMALVADNKTPKEIAAELGITVQKVNAFVKKANAAEDSQDELAPEFFAKSTSVIKDKNMGGAVIMTAREYAEYSEANGRYQGRSKNQKTELNAGELRIAITMVKGGKSTAREMVDHLKNKHGITEKDIVRVAKKMTFEEETSVHQILKPLQIKVQ